MELTNIKRILGKYFFPQEGVKLDRKPLTNKQKMKRKVRNRMARESRRRNR